MKTAINNAFILTMNDEKIFKGNLLIENDEIIAIEDHPFEADEVIDAHENLVMPGLINAHTHIPMSLLRNYADDLPFWPWLTEKIWPAEANLTGRSVYWGSMLSIAEMIASGTTTFNDMYFFTEETIKAVEETGIRALLCRGLVSGPHEDEKLENGIFLFDTYHGALNGRIHVTLGPHAPYTCKSDYLEKISKIGVEKSAAIHIHLSESVKEVDDSVNEHGKTPIEHVMSLGFENNHVIAAHCVQITDEEIERVKGCDFHVVNNPSSNLKLANGFAPLHKIKQAGINIALGTDGPSSNNKQDMFEEMHLAGILNKSVAGDTTFLPAFEVLEMATINGAKALGIDHLVGTLEVGKKADLIIINLDSPNMRPRHNIMSSLVYSANSADVMTVMIDGRVVYKDGQFLTLNLRKIMDNAEKEAQLLVSEQKK
jgi:5-methylthioadenosine/S-adenosylhomocysteine deaminase